MSVFASNGKLLLTSEYLVLDGALALALPTKQKQLLTVKSTSENILHWRSFDHLNKLWFETKLALPSFKGLLEANNNSPIQSTLVEILKAACQLNPDFLSSSNGYEVTTTLEFNRAWGLGTSSTLINNIAQWAEINPFDLLFKSFGGSGYDIACAQSNSPIFYQLKYGKPMVKSIDFNPPFVNDLFFIYLNQKQNSREAIAQYRSKNTSLKKEIELVSKITKHMAACKDLTSFENLIEQHEEIIANCIGQKPIKQRLFNDYDGAVKSLGAWGGDFILATRQTALQYFSSKGYKTIIPFAKMVLHSR